MEDRIIIPQEDIFFDINGTEYCNEELALAQLLIDDVLFCNTRTYLCYDDKTPRERTLVLFVICNDVFAWGCADAESITKAEIPDLYKMHMTDPAWGVVKWCCKKRNLQPQRPLVKRMKEDGAWDESLESLPKNTE